jgi:hypothetical protein
LRSGDVALLALEARARFAGRRDRRVRPSGENPCGSADRRVDRLLGRSQLKSADETPCQRAHACPRSAPGVSARASATALLPAPGHPQLLRAASLARGIIAVIAWSNQVLAVDQSKEVAADVASQPSAVASAQFVTAHPALTILGDPPSERLQALRRRDHSSILEDVLLVWVVHAATSRSSQSFCSGHCCSSKDTVCVDSVVSDDVGNLKHESPSTPGDVNRVNDAGVLDRRNDLVRVADD